MRLKELRKAAGVTQKELATALHVAQNTVCNWENGVRQIDVDYLKKIADYFDVSVSYVLGEDSVQNKEIPQPESQVEAQFAEMFSKLSDANKLEVISRMIAMQAEAGKDR